VRDINIAKDGLKDNQMLHLTQFAIDTTTKAFKNGAASGILFLALVWWLIPASLLLDIFFFLPLQVIGTLFGGINKKNKEV